jgi:hypothetical protein
MFPWNVSVLFNDTDDEVVSNTYFNVFKHNAHLNSI